MGQIKSDQLVFFTYLLIYCYLPIRKSSCSWYLPITVGHGSGRVTYMLPILYASLCLFLPNDLYCVEWDVKPYSTQLCLFLASASYLRKYVSCGVCNSVFTSFIITSASMMLFFSQNLSGQKPFERFMQSLPSNVWSMDTRRGHTAACMHLHSGCNVMFSKHSSVTRDITRKSQDRKIAIRNRASSLSFGGFYRRAWQSNSLENGIWPLDVWQSLMAVVLVSVAD